MEVGNMALSSPQHIGTCALLLNSDNRVLLGKRKNSYKSGYYGLPGGRVEVGESLESAIRREILEETGIEVDHCKYVGVVRETQDGYDFIHFVYVAYNVSAQPKLMEPEKCEGWDWVELDDLGKVLPGHKAAVEMYLGDQKLVDMGIKKFRK